MPGTTSPTPSVEAPTPYLGSATVRAGPAAQADPEAPRVVRMLTRYFRDINSRDFTDYVQLFSREVLDRTDLHKLAVGYRSTHDTDAELSAIRPSRDGREMAVVTFTSHQNPEDAPDGLTCIRWRIHLYLEPAGVPRGYVIGASPSSYHASYSPC